jgi:hypothetical protein
MSIATVVNEAKVSPVFCGHSPIIFDPHMVRAMNVIFHEGSTLKYLSDIENLHVYDDLIGYLGTSFPMSIKGVTPGIRRIEFLSFTSDVDFENHYGELAIFTPAQLWNNVTKVVEHERSLTSQSDSILGEDTHGLVFLVEKMIKDVPKRFAVNLYRERWKDKVAYYLSLFEAGGMWESGHYFALKVSH